MDVPLELLIDYMGYMNPELRLCARDMWVGGIRLMPEDGRMDPGYVYFALYGSGITTPAGSPMVVICPKGQNPGDELQNCIILHTDMSLTTVFNEMLGLQNLILSWRQKVELSVSRREGVQRLLDISGRAFGNPIAIMSASFRTIAATWEFETENRVFWELLELGYLTKESFNSLQSAGYFSPENLSGELVILDGLGADGNKAVMTCVASGGFASFIVLMLCSNTAPSRGLIQVYKLFCEKLRLYLQSAVEDDARQSSRFESLIVDIIEGKITSAREIAERSLLYPAAYTTPFQTVLISHECSSALFLEHAMENLSAVFPGVRQILYGDDIILHPDFGGSESRKASFFSMLSSYLSSARAYAGVSEPSTGLQSVRESYREACEALSIGRRLSRSGICEQMLDSPAPQKRLFLYSRYHIYSILSGNEKTLGALEDIRRYDFEHGSDYYRILFVFLSLERSYTKSAAILRMHRNNVIYHTKKISELFSLDFDDPNLRLRLLLLYRLSDLLASG